MSHRFCHNLISTVAFTFIAIRSTAGFSELLINPIVSVNAGQGTIEGSFTNSEVDYELKNISREIERNIFAVSAQYGVKDSLAVFFQLGISNKVEFETISESGDGYMIGTGVRGVMFAKDKFKLFGYGLLNLTQEEIKDISSNNTKLDIGITEIEAGAVGSMQATPEFSLYGGLSLVPYSDGETKLTSGSTTVKSDIERDDVMILRLGAQFSPAHNLALHAGVSAFSEMTLGMGVTYLF